MTTEIKMNTVNGNPLRTYIYKNGVENPDYPITITGIKKADHIELSNNSTYIKPNIDLAKYQVFIKAELLYPAVRNASCGLIIDNVAIGGEPFLLKTGPTIANVAQTQIISYFNKNLFDMYIRQINGMARIYEIWLEETA